MKQSSVTDIDVFKISWQLIGAFLRLCVGVQQNDLGKSENFLKTYAISQNICDWKNG